MGEIPNSSLNTRKEIEMTDPGHPSDANDDGVSQEDQDSWESTDALWDD